MTHDEAQIEVVPALFLTPYQRTASAARDAMQKFIDQPGGDSGSHYVFAYGWLSGAVMNSDLSEIQATVIGLDQALAKRMIP